MIQCSKIYTPFGKLTIFTNNIGIFKIGLPNISSRLFLKTSPIQFSDIHKKAIKELKEYFFNSRKKFSISIYLNINPFYSLVLNEVKKIPYGETRSYKEIALKINYNKAYRAVGLANKKNPIPIIIPCHRVIKSDGQLGGYGGGNKLKKKLLELEVSSS